MRKWDGSLNQETGTETEKTYKANSQILVSISPHPMWSKLGACPLALQILCLALAQQQGNEIKTNTQARGKSRVG